MLLLLGLDEEGTVPVGSDNGNSPPGSILSLPKLLPPDIGVVLMPATVATVEGGGAEWFGIILGGGGGGPLGGFGKLIFPLDFILPSVWWAWLWLYKGIWWGVSSGPPLYPLPASEWSSWAERGGSAM
jgi:hypothetical protein